jgi:ribosomal protein S18 acetylase RimI-like enzyme
MSHICAIAKMNRIDSRLPQLPESKLGRSAGAAERASTRKFDCRDARKRLPNSPNFVQASVMGDHPIVVRAARPDDAPGVARVYIESWHDTYPSILPTQLLCAMTPKGQTARWQAAIQARGREQVLVAEKAGAGVIAMTSFGPSRDSELGFDGEIYTLYVDPSYFGLGLGRALLRSAFSSLGARGYSSCVIWAHTKNPARFFYEKMGGRLIAERTARMMGDSVPETAFGWRRLALAERSTAR